MAKDKLYLGVELGSTRIKAVGINETLRPVISGDYTWKSDFRDGFWTYSLDEVWVGLRAALTPFGGERPDVMGVSAMMHGYLAFDKDWNLLTPFRTWQNTTTACAAEELTELFGFNIPQRWSIAHLYQAVLNGEAHVKNIAHITTLAGYVHYMLTGVNALGIGDASGMFPVDGVSRCYDRRMLDKFDALIADRGFGWTIREILPKILVAGESAGKLTASGSDRLGGLLPEGISFAPCEGDAGTGMSATNAISPRSGNVSAGTSIFAMVVLEEPLSHVHSEIDVVSTPVGNDVAMVHCNNCTNDMNAWVSLLGEAVALFGKQISTGELFTKLYEKSLDGESDCGGVTVVNYIAGESITGMDEGRPMVTRGAESRLTLANFLRAQLYSTMATLKIGMDILNQEGVVIDSITGHGGLFKTPLVGQRYLAAACGAPVTCMETAGEGGPYGMALLAAYVDNSKMSLSDFLNLRVFTGVKSVTVKPDRDDAAGFNCYLKQFKSGLKVEEAAVKYI